MSPSKVPTIDWQSFGNVIDGKVRSADKFHQGVDPTTGQKLWDVPIANQQDVDDAVAAGSKAYESWSQTPIEKRKDYMRKYIELYKTYENEMTEVLKKETGKPVSAYATSNLRTHANVLHTAFLGQLRGERSGWLFGTSSLPRHA